ncbi:MAG: D-serine ammonia-lyase [Clostridiales bacterium]|nr:D-serine ammonia-lyase [Clostridiales bacterium]
MAIKYRTEKLKTDPLLRKMQAAEEVIWINPDRIPFAGAKDSLELSMKDIEDAEARLLRFAPFIMKCFPETEAQGGIIESALTEIPDMRARLNEKYGSHLQGRLFLKQDSHLAIAGSVKARGGIYEVLKHTEELALSAGILKENDDYAKLAQPQYRDFFARYTIQAGSTGNLGMSIGIMGAAIGYHVIIHMSAEARSWKKKLLRNHGVSVIEYREDYGEAVKNGRRQSERDPLSYFVDDENSRDLFLGYATAAKRLTGQLREKQIPVDMEHPLFVYIPCGVGGAPGGITFGLKQVFGDAVHCFFAEPVQAPCMLAGMSTGLNNAFSVQDLGLTGLTHADGLAVGRPSGFVGSVMKPVLDGEFTIDDGKLYDYMRDMLETENIFLEPSACAAFQGPARLEVRPETCSYLEENDLMGKMKNASHIVWATGGSLVPEEIREEYKKTVI